MRVEKYDACEFLKGDETNTVVVCPLKSSSRLKEALESVADLLGRMSLVTSATAQSTSVLARGLQNGSSNREPRRIRELNSSPLVCV